MAFSSPSARKSSRVGLLKDNKAERVTGSREEVERVHQHYIAKISELHNVIADLSRKLEPHKHKTREETKESSHSEEEEEEDDEGSCNSRCSTNNNNLDESCSGNEDLIHPAAILAMTSPKTYASELSAGAKVVCKEVDDRFRLKKVSMEKTDIGSGLASMENALQMCQLQEDVLLLKSENEILTRKTLQLDAELESTKNSFASLKDERDRLRRKVRELHGKLQTLSGQCSQESQTASPTKSQSSKVNSTGAVEGSSSCKDDALVTKIAERIRLRRMEEGDRHILGSEISFLGVSSAKMAEHLVQQVKEESSAQEIFHSLSSNGSQLSESVIKEFELEMERLNSRMEHIKSQNDLLTLNLEESKCQCDRVSVLIGKYESNNTALQLALVYSDQTVEATEILLRLMETETALVVAKCHAAGLTNRGESGEREEAAAAAILKHSHDNRKAVEALAKRMLQKLDRNFRLANSCGDRPWEDISSHSHTASTNSSSSSFECELTKSDEQRLRNYVVRLKNERALIRTTITELESVHVDPLSREPSSSSDAQRLDFENAVLMQELMALKEDKAEFKAQLYVLEKEKSALELKLDGRVAQEQAYIAHIEHLKSEVKEQEQSSEKLKNNVSWEWDQAQCFEQSEDLSQSLVEALHREKKLKSRIQELVSALDKVTKNSDLRQQQSIEFVNDLKRGNSALIATFDKSKKKYQSKIKKLEQQMITLTERHLTQVRSLQQRINALEEQIPGHKFHAPSETSL